MFLFNTKSLRISFPFVLIRLLINGGILLLMTFSILLLMFPMNQLAMSLMILQKTLDNLTLTFNGPHVQVDTEVIFGVPFGSMADMLMPTLTPVLANPPLKCPEQLTWVNNIFFLIRKLVEGSANPSPPNLRFNPFPSTNVRDEPPTVKPPTAIAPMEYSMPDALPLMAGITMPLTSLTIIGMRPFKIFCKPCPPMVPTTPGPVKPGGFAATNARFIGVAGAAGAAGNVVGAVDAVGAAGAMSKPTPM
jgi:hypothetical protein